MRFGVSVALVSLITVSGCNANNGELSRDQALTLFQSKNPFGKEFQLRDKLAMLKCLQNAGALRMVSFISVIEVQLTDVGKSFIESAEAEATLEADSGWQTNITFARGLPLQSIAITGIRQADTGPSTRIADYTAQLSPPIGEDLLPARQCVGGHGNIVPVSGHVTFQKFDDGWRETEFTIDNVVSH